MAVDRAEAAATFPEEAATPSRAPGSRRAAARISPKQLAEARRLFETSGLSERQIAGRIGVHRSSVGRLAHQHGWRRPTAAEARQTLVASIRRKAEREVVAATRALKDAGDPGPAARTLASLVRTLRELAKYDEEQARAAGRADAVDDEDFDDFIADPDAFRDALAERLEKLRDEREA